MAGEANKAVLWRLIEEGFGGGEMASVDELVDAGLVEHQSNIYPKDREGVKECIRMLHRAFPDFRVTHEHSAVDGDLVWCHFRARGTHTGPLGPFPPTGKAMEIQVFDLARIRDGRIVEHWGVPDLFNQLEQLGLLPQRRETRAA
jgi:predicted ester cyclase